jgi:putative N6-adenine-specific DNA methylase
MFTFVAPCAIGAEKVLANELKRLGFAPVIREAGAAAVGHVSFSPSPEETARGVSGILSAAYRANLSLRTADRVYLELASFPAADFDSLFEGVKAIRWQDWFRKDVKVVIDKVRTRASRLSSEHSVQGIAHKAIYACLGEVWRMSMLPETGTEVTVRVYIDHDVASILLDLSGEPLHRRGYRTSAGEAPIRETLAAILLQLMAWRRKTPLHDAFCGSGTIPIEAMLFAHDIAPGLGREFALENLVPFQGEDAKKMIKAERERAARAIRTDCLVRITGSDIDENVLAAARANAERAASIAGRALKEIGSDARIVRPDFTRASFVELAAPYDEGLLLSNPPWGERLEDKDSARKLYSSMHRLFADFPGWDMGFITSHQDFEQSIGKKAGKSRKLKSGNLDTVFYIYETGR